MKYTAISFVLGAFMATGVALAQSPAAPNMPVDEVTKLITYTDVIDEPGLNKDTLYNRGLRWFKVYFKNPAQALKNADAANHQIDGGYKFVIKRPDPAVKKDPKPMVDAGTVNFKMKLQFKDGKFKYEITNIAWAQTSYYPIERWMDTESKGYDPNFASYLQQTDDYVKEMTESLQNFLETTPLKKKDDW